MVSQVKAPLFNAVKILKDKYIESDYLEKTSQAQSKQIVGLLKDMSKANWNQVIQKEQVPEVLPTAASGASKLLMAGVSTVSTII